MIQGDRKLRVLHVVRTLSVGGLEMGVVNVVKRLDELGFQQGVLCLEHPGELAEQVSSVVPVWSCAATKKRIWDRHEFRAIGVVRRFRPDVVHARNYGAWLDGAFAWVAAGCPGRLVCSIHGFDSTNVISWRRAICVRWLARLTYGLAAVSEETAREFAAECRIASEKFRILSSGVDTNKFQPALGGAKRKRREDGPCVIGFVGRLVPVKNLSVLLQAIRTIKDRRHIELRIIGDGPERSRVESFVRQWKLEDVVQLLGSRDDIEAQLRECDIFVLSSSREGRPTSVMEAMATGLPIVASAVGAIPSLVAHGVEGMLVDSQSVDGFAKSLAELVDSEELRRKLGAAAREKAVKSLSLDVMAAQYADYYHCVAKKHRK